MATGLLGIALSSLNAFQRALDVTGNNIANSRTPGYSRQSLNLVPRAVEYYGGHSIGTGVLDQNIQRYADQYANQQVRTTLSVRSQYDALFQQSSQVDKLLSSEGTSISKSMQTFFSSFSKMNESPQDMVKRSVALQDLDSMVKQFNNTQQQLNQYQFANGQGIRDVISQINSYSKSIADLNQQLQTHPDSLDLLDQRDQTLKELSALIDVSVVTQSDGSVNVSLGNGESLVIGTQTMDLSVSSNANATSGTTIAIGNGSGIVDITNSIHSGQLGGLLDYEKKVLIPSSQALGQLAISLGQTFNAQHHLGMDLNNQLGTDVFGDFNSALLQASRASASPYNTGTGALSVSISDISQTKLSDYNLVVTDASSNQVKLVRKSDGQVTNLTFTSSPPAPPAGQIQLDGMTITVDNLANMQDNDTYSISPTAGAANSLSLQITDARQFALASPVRAQAAIANSGSGKVVMGPVLNTAVVNKNFQINFISPTQFNVVNVTDSVTTGPFSYDPNGNNTIQIPDGGNPSYSVVISGAPKTGDQFNLEYNTNGFGDSKNGLALTNIQTQRILNGGSTTLFDGYSQLVSNVGSQAAQSLQKYSTADSLYTQAESYRGSISGVNMDEELANMLKYQQAYQAAGRLVAVSNQLMDVLMSVMR